MNFQAVIPIILVYINWDIFKFTAEILFLRQQYWIYSRNADFTASNLVHYLTRQGPWDKALYVLTRATTSVYISIWSDDGQARAILAGAAEGGAPGQRSVRPGQRSGAKRSVLLVIVSKCVKWLPWNQYCCYKSQYFCCKVNYYPYYFLLFQKMMLVITILN